MLSVKSLTGSVRFGLCALAATAASAPSAFAYFGAPGKQVAVKKSMNTSPYGYYEYLPQDYSDTSGKKFPVILFLHGSGERGDGETTLSRVVIHGPPKLVNQGRAFSALVITPQATSSWSTATLDQFVDYVYSTYKGADPDRLYVTGLSMGGGGAWQYATAFPDRVAALVPICGAAGATASRSVLYGKPIWAFHSYNDTSVSYKTTSDNINLITRAASVLDGAALPPTKDQIALFYKSKNAHQWFDGNTTKDSSADAMIRFTLYQSGGHDSWTRAYNNEDLWNWIFLQSKQTKTDTVAFDSGSLTVDFGDAKATSGAINIAGESLAAGGSIANLLNQASKRTSAALKVVKRFNGVNRNGTKTPAAATGFDSSTASDSWFGNDVAFGGVVAPSAQLELSGLNPALSYDFRFFASRMGASGENRETQYEVSGASAAIAYLNVSENTANVAQVAGVRPNSAGKVAITLKKGPKNNNAYGFFYLGGMKVTANGASAPLAQEIRIDFGAPSVPLPAHWNDGRGLIRSGGIALKTMTGATTPYDLTVLSPFNNVNHSGTASPAPALDIPSVASQDSFFGNDVLFESFVAPKAVLEIRDLDPSKAYTFEFYASRMSATENRETQYAVIGATSSVVKLDVANNTSKAATSAGVKPNANGVIRIEISKGSANKNAYGFFYLGSMRIRY